MASLLAGKWFGAANTVCVCAHYFENVFVCVHMLLGFSLCVFVIVRSC